MTLVDLGRALVVAAGLLLPGLGWAFAFRWPLAWFAAGMLSALAIFSGVLLAALAGVPVTFWTLAAWLGLVGVSGWWYWRGTRLLTPQPPAAGVGEWWLALPAIPLLGVALWRACCQPLSGADVSFRWNLVAELLFETGGLASYPPVAAAQFMEYFWADGIPPLVSSLYAWAYLAHGSVADRWTIPVALAQSAGLLVLLFGLGRQWQGVRAGWFACAVGGATMLLQFSFNLGQETGLTALGTGGMFFYLVEWRATRDARLLVPAALCAAVAACAREYGVIAAVAGAAWMLASTRHWRAAAGFALCAALLPAIWQARVFALTGNPVYAQSFAGFPTNPVFDTWMKYYREIYGGELRHIGSWLEIGRIGFVTALPAFAGLCAGLWLWRARPAAGLVWALTLAFIAVWLASIAFTAGGLFYSMRVLSPVLLLGCAFGGSVLARWVPGRAHLAGVLAGLSLFAVDASLRAWVIPGNPYSLAPSEWPSAGNQIRAAFDREDRPFLARAAAAADGRVLSDSAGLREFFREAGKTYSPLWSPDVAWLFSGKVVPDAPARLRALGFSHLLLKRSEFSTRFLTRTGALPSLQGSLRPVMANETFILLEIAHPPAGEKDRHD